MQLAKKFKYIL